MRKVYQWFNFIFGCFIIVLIIIFLVDLGVSINNLNIIRLDIYSNYQYTTPISVKKALKPLLKQKFLPINISDIKNNLMTLPWVEHVFIYKEGLGVIKIYFSEYQPIARWQKKSLITKNGMIINVSDMKKFSDLPLFVGTDVNLEHFVRQYNFLKNQVLACGLTINQLNYNSIIGWFFIANNQKFIIGQKNEVIKLNNLRTLCTKVLSRQWHRVAVVDMRYENGVAVTWK